ncbi:MAG: XrtA system polysaccharide chain length determinant [Kangiellaceae bacterium]|jgi:protein tyrosine kinase modulator
MNATLEFFIRIIAKEAWARKKLVVSLYIVVSMLFAGLAWVWPQVFTSSATIIVDERNIIKPIMEGIAPTTALSEPLKFARNMMDSRTTLREVLTVGGWINDNTPQQQVDSLMDDMRSKTVISNTGKTIVHISFRDKDPQRAYIAAKTMSEIFIRESYLYKQRESERAYQFINGQAESYLKKLQAADQAIKEFREKNVDSTPGAMQAANTRILELTRSIEDINIEILGEESKLAAQQEQLAGGGGAKNTASIEREGALRARIATLKGQLEDLRLIYKDTYPDIVQINAQIEATEKQIQSEIEARNSNTGLKSEELSDSPIAQTLRSDILLTQTSISALKSRRAQLNVLLENERQKVNRINSVEAEITELTRESAVNKTKYNQLIDQRESARISRDMDLAKQGINARIQEEAFLPASPKGLRFMHLIIVGLVFSIGFPLSIVFGLTLLDQKVRDKRVISEKLQLPVLASVYPVKSTQEKRADFTKKLVIASIVIVIWSIYGYEIWLKAQG